MSSNSVNRLPPRAPCARQLVEHAVDVLVAVGAAVRLRQLDRFVDRHAVRHVRRVQQLPRADDENALFDRRDFAGLAVEIRRVSALQRVVLAGHALPQRVEQLAVAAGEAGDSRQLRADRVRRVARSSHWYRPCSANSRARRRGLLLIDRRRAGSPSRARPARRRGLSLGARQRLRLGIGGQDAVADRDAELELHARRRPAADSLATISK